MLTPLFVAVFMSNGHIGDQVWYELGGVVSSTVLLIVGTAFVQDMWHVVKPMPASRIVGRTR